MQKLRKTAAKVPTRKDVGEDFARRGFVTCGHCNQPYTACWSKGKYKKYPYYFCDTKTCVSYRKPIPRARVEGDFGTILRRLQPAKMLVEVVTAMVKTAWQHREAQATDSNASLNREVAALDKQVDGLLTRLVDASNTSVIKAYEAKIAELDRKKAILIEKSHAAKQPKGKVDDFIELSLRFLANPWKLLETGNMTLRKTVLKLAFQERPTYHRNEGYRTPKTTLPFKALAGFETGESVLVRSRGMAFASINSRLETVMRNYGGTAMSIVAFALRPQDHSSPVLVVHSWPA